MTSCRSTRETTLQSESETVRDTVWREMKVCVHDTLVVTERDTIRETLTVTLAPGGDTARTDRLRERVTDRQKEHTSQSRQSDSTAASHQAERSQTTEHDKATVGQAPAAGGRWKAFWQGFGVGGGVVALAVGIIGIVRIIRRGRI